MTEYERSYTLRDAANLSPYSRAHGNIKQYKEALNLYGVKVAARREVCRDVCAVLDLWYGAIQADVYKEEAEALDKWVGSWKKEFSTMILVYEEMNEVGE